MENQEESFGLRQRALYNFVKNLLPVKELAKKWYYHAGMKFLKSRELTDEEEAFLEEITDFYIDDLNNIEKDKNFLKKIKLDPIKLPEKKIKV